MIFRHKKILNYSLYFILLFVISCQKNPVIKAHGVPYLDIKEKKLEMNISNENDVKKVLGSPSTIGTFDNSVWIYIEREISRGKLLKFGRNILKKNNVLVLKFDKHGILTSKDFYDKKSINKIKFSSKETSTINKEKDFIYSFVSSMRKKINDPLSKKSRKQ